MEIILNCLFGATAFLFVIIGVVNGDYAFELYKQKKYKSFKYQLLSTISAWFAAFVCVYLIFN